MNSYYPYNNYNTYPTQMNVAPTQPTQTGIMWVQGSEGAKAYPVAAGNSVLLMDSEESVFYIKTTDPSGMPQPLRVFDYKERNAQQPSTSEYVTKDELEKRLAQLQPSQKKVKRDE